MDRGQRIALATGGGLVLVGVGGLFWKWWGAKNEQPPPKDLILPYGWQPGMPTSLPPGSHYAKVTSFDQSDFGGGWILRDVRGARDPKLDPDKDAHVGMTAALVLTYKEGGVPKVFLVKIIGISGDDYQSQWTTQPPSGSGVQLPEFRGAHILTLHK